MSINLVRKMNLPFKVIQQNSMTPSTTKHSITPVGAAPAAGPYSHAIRSGDFVFVSGQVPRDPATGAVVSCTVAEQSRRMLENVRAVPEAADVGFGDVVKTTVCMTDMADFAAMNEVYAQYFPAPCPARSTVAVAALPLAARMEIDLIAAAVEGRRP